MALRSTLVAAMACAAGASACSDLLGADFDDVHLRTNRPPVVADVTLENVVEGTTGNTLQLSATDREGDTLTYYLPPQQARGRPSIADPSSALLSYESDYGTWTSDGFEDLFRYGARDATHSVEANVRIRLLPAGPRNLGPATPTPDFVSYFGASVDFDGDRAIIGATFDGAYVLRRQENGTWDHVHKIDPPARYAGDRDIANRSFGWKAALSGEWALVGAYGFFDSPSPPGQALFYKWREATQKYEFVKTVCAVPDNCDAGPVDRFGIDVALDGRFAVIAAKHDPVDHPDPVQRIPDAGAVYVYELVDGDQWRLAAKLRAPRPAAGDWFGSSIALDGETLAVGAPGTDTENASDSGTVYVYENGTWRQPDAVPKPLPLPQLGFPVAGFQMGQVALSGDHLLVGAPEALERKGLAFFYERMDGAWRTQQTLREPEGLPDVPDPLFGLGVAIDGDLAVVTRRGINVDGAAVIYRREETHPGPEVKWQRRRTWISAFTNSAGWTVGVRGTAVLVGAPHSEPDGAVFAFHVPLDPQVVFPDEPLP